MDEDVYLTGVGLECVLIKSFNDNEHIVQYIYVQEDYNHDYGYTSDNAYSIDSYYQGTLQRKVNFDIKKDERYQKLKDEITELETKKRQLSTDIYSLNSELRDSIKESEKFKPLKNLFEFIDGSKNFLFACSGWGFRIFDLRTEKEITNVDDEDSYYNDIFDFSKIQYSLTINLSNYGNKRAFKPFLELKSNNYKVKDVDFDSRYTIELFNSIEEILQYVHANFITEKYSLDFLQKIYSACKTPLPDDVKEIIKQKNKLSLESQLNERKKEALQKQKEADELERKINSMQGV